MKKIIKSAEQVYNDIIENLKKCGEYHYGDSRAYYKEDGKYYKLYVDSPDSLDLRDVLECLDDAGYHDIKDGLRFYDYGDSSDDEWNDYLDWFVSNNHSYADELEPETEDCDVASVFDKVALIFRGNNLKDIYDTFEEGYATKTNDSVEFIYEDLVFTAFQENDGTIKLSDTVRASNSGVYLGDAVFDEVVLTEPKEYGENVSMRPYSQMLKAMCESVLNEISVAYASGLNINPHYRLCFHPKILKGISWDEVSFTHNGDGKMMLSFIVGTVSEPSTSVDIYLDEFPVEELIRMYNSLR